MACPTASRGLRGATEDKGEAGGARLATGSGSTTSDAGASNVSATPPSVRLREHHQVVGALGRQVLVAVHREIDLSRLERRLQLAAPAPRAPASCPPAPPPSAPGAAGTAPEFLMPNQILRINVSATAGGGTAISDYILNKGCREAAFK